MTDPKRTIERQLEESFQDWLLKLKTLAIRDIGQQVLHELTQNLTPLPEDVRISNAVRMLESALEIPPRDERCRAWWCGRRCILRAADEHQCDFGDDYTDYSAPSRPNIDVGPNSYEECPCEAYRLDLLTRCWERVESPPKPETPLLPYEEMLREHLAKVQDVRLKQRAALFHVAALFEAFLIRLPEDHATELKRLVEAAFAVDSVLPDKEPSRHE